MLKPILVGIGIPFWLGLGEFAIHFRLPIFVVGLVDVHWGANRAFDPWPHVRIASGWTFFYFLGLVWWYTKSLGALFRPVHSGSEVKLGGSLPSP